MNARPHDLHDDALVSFDLPAEETSVPTSDPIGRPMPRVEDDRLLRGRSTYVSDLAVRVDALHVAFVRSPHAHACIRSIDADQATAIDGVHLVLTADDFRGMEALPADWVPDGMVHEAHHPLLAHGKVRYWGEPVAVVIASGRHVARDGAEAVRIDYDPLPATVDQEAALSDGAPIVHEGAGDNLAFHKTRSGGNFERALRKADVVIERRLTNNRVTASPMEGRAVLSEYDAVTGQLTHRTSTQLPHVHARSLAACLDHPLHKLRLVSPDVGGGFGAKLGFYAEDVVVALAAKRTGRPCLWVQSREENLTSNTHGRDHVQYATLTAKRDGSITGLRTRIVADLGAYALGMGPGVPAINAGFMVTGPYRIPNMTSEVQLAYTNRVPTGPYRGAGHPEATFLIERMVDELAAELDLDPADVRRRNFVPPSAMPYLLPGGFVLDSGDYAANLDAALEAVGYDELRTWQRQVRNGGRIVGIGVCTYSETSGAAPSMGMAAVGFRRSGHESARVVMHPDGRVTVFSGGHSHGQGHATSLAQIAASVLQVPVADVDVVQGDTAVIPFGTGTYNSRTIAVGGSAIHEAATKIVAKMKRIAAEKLGCAPRDVVFENGRFERQASADPRSVAGGIVRRAEGRVKPLVMRRMSGLHLPRGERSQRTIPLTDIVREAHLTHDAPLGMVPGLDETIFFDPKDMPASYATHVSVVEIDPALGHVGLLRHLVVDDCGTVINPLLAAGQVHGGAAQGIGQALMEHASYDADGLPLAASLHGYAMPRATDLPVIETSHTVTPTKLNPLGAKGIGEGATIGATPALANAVHDALRPWGVNEVPLPFTPQTVWQACRARR